MFLEIHDVYKQCISSARYKKKQGSTKSMAFVIYTQTIYFDCPLESLNLNFTTYGLEARVLLDSVIGNFVLSIDEQV